MDPGADGRPAADQSRGDSARGPEADDDLPPLEPPGRPDSLGRVGHYEMLEVLGRGGFGVVYRAFDEVLQRVVAVKVLAPRVAATSPARKRFLREARSSAAVRHENVVQVHAVAERPVPYLVMEFVPGETLQARIDRDGPLPTGEAARIGRQVAAGLAAAHATGLVHRDVKPANVLIEAGPAGRARLTDFGLARAADDASLSRSGSVAGTPLYMAPEQARGEALDHRADLFSLGSVLYAMLTGRPPFRAGSTYAVLKRVAEDTPRPILEVIPEVPARLCRIVSRLHAKDPARRYQSAGEVADALADCEERSDSRSDADGRTRVPSIMAARRPAWGWAAAAGTLVLLVALGASALTQPVADGPAPPPPPPASPAPKIPPAAPAGGWVSLFNGKDLTGWRTHPSQPGRWVVADGAITCAGPQSHLFSEKQYAAAHIRAEARVGRGVDGSLMFRVKYGQWSTGPFGRIPLGYQALINADGDQVVARTGTLLWQNVLSLSSDSRHRLDEWFVMEVRADGDTIRAWVNGELAAEAREHPGRHQRGCLALSHMDPDTSVAYRKIEVMELPPR